MKPTDFPRVRLESPFPRMGNKNWTEERKRKKKTRWSQLTNSEIDRRFNESTVNPKAAFHPPERLPKNGSGGGTHYASKALYSCGVHPQFHHLLVTHRRLQQGPLPFSSLSYWESPPLFLEKGLNFLTTEALTITFLRWKWNSSCLTCGAWPLAQLSGAQEPKSQFRLQGWVFSQFLADGLLWMVETGTVGHLLRIY